MTLLAFLYLPICLALLVGFIGGAAFILWAIRRGVLEVKRCEAGATLDEPTSIKASGALRLKALTGLGRR